MNVLVKFTHGGVVHYRWCLESMFEKLMEEASSIGWTARIVCIRDAPPVKVTA
jgi:hypothetical protein